jgi:hypothetical protein
MAQQMLDSITRRQIQREFRAEQQQKYERKMGIMPMTAGVAGVGVVAGNTKLWQSRPRLFDVSDYQPKVNWKAIFDQDPDCAGAIIKIFEPFDNAGCGSLDCNYWFEDTASKHMTDIYNYTNSTGDRKVISVYVYGNPSRSAALDLSWYKTLDNGTPQERLSKWMRDDAHIYGLIRALKIGWRANKSDDITTLKNMGNAFFDEINMDWERPWKQYLPKPALTAKANILAPNVIGEVIRRTHLRIDQLIDWGIFPQHIKNAAYSANWFIQSYLTDTLGNQFAFDGMDTWDARYMTFSKTGVMSIAQMVELYGEIPDNFDFLPFGNPKKVQVTGDALKIPEMCSDLGPTGLDGNVFLGTWEEMECYYERPILRGVGSVVPVPDPDPTPDPIPDPLPLKKKFIKNKRNVNVRYSPDSNSTTNVVGLVTGIHEFELVEEEAHGPDLWNVVKLYVAKNVGGVAYTEPPVER